MTICACGNTKPNTQEAAPVVEDTVEVVKEQGTVFLDITLEEALEKAKGHYGQFEGAAKYIDPRHE